MKKFIKCFVCLTVILFFCGCEKNSNKLVMVTESGFAPYEYRSGEEIIGVDVDIANEIAKKLGKELVIKDVDFGSIINELNSGKADFAAAGMSIDEERKKSVDFSELFYEDSNVCVVKKGKEDMVKSADDLKDLKVAFLTARKDEQTVVQGFKLGISDYITKPIDKDVVRKRIKKILASD